MAAGIVGGGVATSGSRVVLGGMEGHCSLLVVLAAVGHKQTVEKGKESKCVTPWFLFYFLL